jgi:S-adenosyl-L-methionine hydrolase (adenosine-forming)
VRAIITLTTDFGLRDSYVAQMKAVILGIIGDVHIVDISHEVEPHDITAGALTLEEAVGAFPPGTVHVAVVDPGVGTRRRGLAVAVGGFLLVGPDNGLFTPFLEGDRWEAVEISAPEFRRPVVSRTFHGRDIFAPAAAHLATGLQPSRLGPAVHDPVRLSWPAVHAGDSDVAGVVIHVDRFGNLVTSITAERVALLGSKVVVRVGNRVLPLVNTYADLERGQPGALIGSANRLEVAVREGSAQACLNATRGTPVVLTRPCH